MNEHSIILG